MAQLTDDAFAFGGDLMRIEEALAHVAAHVPPIAETERVALAAADGRVLARPLLAPVDLPPFDNSAVDGWAVAHADLAPEGPTEMEVGGRVTAGHGAGHRAERGRAVRIFTGAPMPEGCDTVFMQEDVTIAGNQVTVPKGLALGARMAFGFRRPEADGDVVLAGAQHVGDVEAVAEEGGAAGADQEAVDRDGSEGVDEIEIEHRPFAGGRRGVDGEAAAELPFGAADPLDVGLVAADQRDTLAEALAVQLDLAGVSAAEIMDVQRAVETLGAELAAEHATAADIAKLRQLLADAEASIADLDAFTRLSRDFHLAVAEASHNRVIVVQLLSLEHISWPRRNATATPKLARHIIDTHSKLVDFIEMRDASAARALMNDHGKVIRARRVAEHGHSHEAPEEGRCC